jgi:DNA (cytosine-5)-methyltransferase 3A
VYSTEGKSVTLSANGGGLGAKTGLYDTGSIRKLTPIECERLQGLPDNYTEGIAMTNRYKCLGNAFNVDVVAHILAGVRK